VVARLLYNGIWSLDFIQSSKIPYKATFVNSPIRECNSIFRKTKLLHIIFQKLLTFTKISVLMEFISQMLD